MELEEAAAGVVEDAVEHDADAPGVGFVDQPAEGRVAAEHRVDLLVVVRVIAMVRGRLEDRREVDGVDAQVAQIVEMLDDADQVAALVAVIRRRRAPLVEVPGLGDRQAPREPIGEDLVEDRVADPVGRLGARSPGAAPMRCHESAMSCRPASVRSYHRRDLVPVELLAVAAEAEVLEHRLERRA